MAHGPRALALDGPLPTGRLRQVPPAYSAVHVDGRRAYELARAGVAVDLPSREVDVSRFDLLWREGDRAGVRDRLLQRDLREALADRRPGRRLLPRAAAHAGSGPFDVADADPSRVVTLGDALGRRPPGGGAGRRRRRGALATAWRWAVERPVQRAGGCCATADGPIAVCRAAGGRRAQARRRLPVRMKVIAAPRRRPRPRRVAVGTFDGVHLGHREVISGNDTVLTSIRTRAPSSCPTTRRGC